MVASTKPLQLQPAGVRFVGKGSSEAEAAYEVAEAEKLKAAISKIKSLKEPSAQAVESVKKEEVASANKKKND